uniref:Uncharacterized protein n=1 Tax=Acetithermum autotrophicum TaxID=1446466 RepID=H5SVB8_ACEAU|nr:hypothetical protein HGMM_OP4C183 [Candidatus Acetothermum autotrophicum]
MISRMLAFGISWLLGSLLLGTPSVGAAPVNGTLEVELMLLPTSGEEKINAVDIKFGGELSLHLHVGDLTFSSLSAFTFKGLESQVFTGVARLGSALARDTIVFSPNLIEVEQQRNLAGLPVYCASFVDPALPIETDLTLPLDVGLPACPVTTDNDLAAASLYYLIEGNVGLYTISDFVHPIFTDLTFARIFEGAGHLDQPLSLRKKIVELELALGVFRVDVQGLFANVGSIDIPSWQRGFLVAFEMQLDELLVRSETWVGSKPGVECFGECSLLQRFHNGVIAPGAIEGRLFIRNLKVAGILFGAQAEFGLDGSSFHLRIIELTQQFTVMSHFLTVLNTVRIAKLAFTSIQVLSQSIITRLQIGDVTATAVFNIWPKTDGTATGIRFYWNRLITVFTPPGIKLTSDIQVCQDPNICGILPAVLTHDLYFTASVGDLVVDILLGFSSFIMEFRQAAIDVTWRLGNVVLRSTTLVSGNALMLQMFGFTLQF